MPSFPGPSATATPLLDTEAGLLLDGAWQIELRGVLFRGADCDGPLVVTSWFEGLGMPQTRDADVARPMQHGSFPSPQFLGDRTLTCEIGISADDADEFHDALTDLGLAWRPVSPNDDDLVVPLCFTLDSVDRAYFVRGKPQRVQTGYSVLARVAPSAYFSESAVCEFLAVDPRIYALEESNATLSLGSASGGHGFPLGFPHGFGTATSGAEDCINDGSIETYPIITVVPGASGASAISLTNTTTGEAWAITLTVDFGDTLVVNMGERTVLLNGTADRSPLVVRPPSVWWALQPGSNVIQLGATGADTTAEIVWHDAHLL